MSAFWGVIPLDCEFLGRFGRFEALYMFCQYLWKVRSFAWSSLWVRLCCWYFCESRHFLPRRLHACILSISRCFISILVSLYSSSLALTMQQLRCYLCLSALAEFFPLCRTCMQCSIFPELCLHLSKIPIGVLHLSISQCELVASSFQMSFSSPFLSLSAALYASMFSLHPALRALE